MVEGIVKKIMFTGIEKYAKIYDLTDLEVQIKVLNDENGSVVYKMCKRYVEEEDVRFLQIMDKKLDMFGYEALASPFLKKSLIECAEENETNVSQVCCFILKYEDKNKKQGTGLAFYKIEENKPLAKLKVVTLAQHLEKLGI
jgi:hypothetical protein